MSTEIKTNHLPFGKNNSRDGFFLFSDCFEFPGKKRNEKAGHDFLLVRNKIVFVNEQMVNLFAFVVVIAEKNEAFDYKSNVMFLSFW